MNWISVEDEMPKIKYGTWSIEDYLVLTMYGYSIGRTKEGQWVDMDNDTIEDVTHYMPLPELPILINKE